MVTKGERRGKAQIRILGFTGTYTTYKIENKKDFLYSTGNYIQYLIIAYKEKECIYTHIQIYICIYIYESLYCIPETSQTL